MIGALTHLNDELLQIDEEWQLALRRAVARAMQRRYHFANADERMHMQWNVIPPELPPLSPTATAGMNEQQRDQQRRDRELREVFEHEEVTTLPAYARRMFYPAAGSQVAWANANNEGPYVAQFLARPLFVVNQLTPDHAIRQRYTLNIFLLDGRQLVIKEFLHFF